MGHQLGVFLEWPKLLSKVDKLSFLSQKICYVLNRWKNNFPNFLFNRIFILSFWDFSNSDLHTFRMFLIIKWKKNGQKIFDFFYSGKKVLRIIWNECKKKCIKIGGKHFFIDPILMLFFHTFQMILRKKRVEKNCKEKKYWGKKIVLLRLRTLRRALDSWIKSP